MKFSCPNCGQHIQVDDPVSGEEFACPECGQTLVLPELPAARPVEPSAPVAEPSRVQNCPDCGSVVSIRATSCPHCGAPLAAYAPVVQPVQPTPISRNLADAYRPIIHYFLYAYAILSTIIFCGAAHAERQYRLRFVVAAFFIFVISTIIYRLSIRMKCHRCGYDGKPRRAGGPNFCIFVLLLICGIIPGIVYLLLRPERLICPDCGQEVIR